LDIGTVLKQTSINIGSGKWGVENFLPQPTWMYGFKFLKIQKMRFKRYIINNRYIYAGNNKQSTREGWVKRPGRGAGAQVENGGAVPPRPEKSLWAVASLIKHKNNISSSITRSCSGNNTKRYFS
jgi:hypothetical protein